jgi:hypothetical protein
LFLLNPLILCLVSFCLEHKELKECSNILDILGDITSLNVVDGYVLFANHTNKTSQDLKEDHEPSEFIGKSFLCKDKNRISNQTNHEIVCIVINDADLKNKLLYLVTF